jgi:hypothetical protein
MGRRRTANVARSNLKSGHWARRVCLLCALLAFVRVAPALAAPPSTATTSRAARSDAIRSIPLDQLDDDAKKKVSSVINHVSLFRRLPTQVVDCDPRYFIFLVRHPEVIVNIWRKMDATDMILERKGPVSFYASDNAGTVSDIEFLYGDQKMHILYCDGSYTGSLSARPVRADCLVLLRSEVLEGKNGRQYVAGRMDVFVSVKNLGVDLVARAMQGVIGTTTDQNFIETANFVTKLGRTTESNGPGVQRLALQLSDLDPAVRQQFHDMAGAVYKKAQASQAVSENTQVTRAQQP